MGVHVDEIHTDVMPALAPAGKTGTPGGTEHLGSKEDAWREAHRAAALAARRTAAVGFDD